MALREVSSQVLFSVSDSREQTAQCSWAWLMPVSPELVTLGQEDCSKFEA